MSLCIPWVFDMMSTHSLHTYTYSEISVPNYKVASSLSSRFSTFMGLQYLYCAITVAKY